MYVALPFIYCILKRFGKSWVLAFVYVASVAVGRLFPLATFVPCFMAGVIAYALLKAVRLRLPPSAWIAFLLLIAVAFASAEEPEWRPRWTLGTCLVVGVSIPLFRANAGWLAKSAAFVAKYSYGIYLAHTPALWLFYRRLELSEWQRAVGALVFTILVSVLCFHAVEDPLIKTAKHLLKRDPAPAMESAAAAAA